MEKWCLDLGFNPDLIDDFCEQFQKRCNPRMKLPWKSIFKHVYPKKEAEIIRKQYLYQLLCKSKQFEKIEVQVNNTEDYQLYKKFKKDEETLKVIQDKVEKKKLSIKEYLAKLQISRQRSINEERELKVKVYKLSQLKKKRITISRLLNKLASDTKLLNIINYHPNTIVGFGSDASEWERQVLILAKELPHGREYQTVLFKLTEILQGSTSSPVPHWDRTEVMSSMEKLLLSMRKKLTSCLSASEEYKISIERKEQETVSLVMENIEGSTNEEIFEILFNYKKDMLKDVEDIGNELLGSKAPYTLEVERNAFDRLQQKCNEHVNNISSLMPIENEEVTQDITLKGPIVDLSLQIDVEKLKNSLSEEISLFMKMSIEDFNQTNPNYINIQTGCTSESQYLKLKDDMKNLLKLMTLSKNISSLIIPSSDSMTISELKEKLNESHSNMSQYIESTSEALEKATKYYERLKAAFDFLRKEPLNQRLTGIEIADEDINVWLNSYIKIKEQLDHEQWLHGHT